MSTRSAEIERLERWPRLPLATLPTRMVQAGTLATHLGLDPASLWIKMDAETGFGLGGNKVRKLEFELAEPRLNGVTHLITTGGPQSNHCRITAAVAAHLGLGCVLVINGSEAGEPRGNALLQRLFGAEIRTVTSREERAPAMDAVAHEISGEGGHALVVPLGASTPHGTLGYALAAVEVADQLAPAPDSDGTWVFVSASSCGTLAGLLLGFSVLGRTDVRLVGVSADVSAGDMREQAVALARQSATLLGYEGAVLEESLHCDDTQVGEGYGIATPQAREAIRLLGRTQGVVLDPVYTGKAAAGWLAWLNEGRVPEGHRSVLVHTGGHPALLT